MRKHVKLGRQEDVGTYNPMDAWEANRLTGHDPAEPMRRLVSRRPHGVDRPGAVAAGEVCVQAIGSFAAKSGGGKRPQLKASDVLRLPQAKPTVVVAVPQQQQLSFTASSAPASSALTSTTPVPSLTAATTAAASAVASTSSASVTATSAAVVASTPMPYLGMRVRGLFDNSWDLGTITKLHENGKFNVSYDDTMLERNVKWGDKLCPADAADTATVAVPAAPAAPAAPALPPTPLAVPFVCI